MEPRVKAWRVHKNGEPREAMRLDEIPDPQPGPGEVLLRVRAANVNFPDALLCRGHYQIRPPLPFTPGVELCGEVLALGEGVTGPEPGTRVITPAALPHGAFAELVVVPAAGVLPAPGALDDAEAAALHIGYQTGWFGLHRRAALQPGETLLVHAAAGGVGSAAVQLGKASGATVIGVVGGPAKAKVARELGADIVVDRHSEDFVAVVKEATGGRGADVVYDPVGGDAYAKSVKCIAFEGRIVVIGFTSGTIPAPALNHALVKNYSILGLHWGLYNTHDPAAIRRCHDELTRLAAEGTVKPLVSERVAFEGAADAVQRVADGVTTGRVVILP
jgi:NADPH2:quinone reductase